MSWKLLRPRWRAALFTMSLIVAAVTVVGAATSLTRSPADGAGRVPAPSPTAAGLTPTMIQPSVRGGKSDNSASVTAPSQAQTTTPETPQGPVVWTDEFSGPAGASPYGPTWHYDLGTNGGWGNQELECYTDAPDNSSLDGAGNLVLTARYTPGRVCSDGTTSDYTSARITTDTLRSVQYGHVRVRAQLPTASGVWPAIWALGTDAPQVGFPASGELDIAEVVGLTPDTVYGTLHAPDASGGPFAASASTSLGAPASAAFHVYGMDWTPNSVAFSVDGAVYSTISRADLEQQGGQWVFDKPFYLLLNVAVGGTFPGPPDDPAAYPQSMRVDYVRVYR